MIIADLEHLEVVAEATSIVGGGKKVFRKFVIIKKEELTPKAKAEAEADSVAVGTQTKTFTATNTEAVAGVFSLSSSRSSAEAKGDN
jgi:archaeosine-15-forming tRNA-guanine transglycosylase